MKKISLFLFVLAMAFPICASGASPRGDVNGDGNVNIADVSDLIDYLLSNDASMIVIENADIDGDGNVNIADLSDVIDMLLNPSLPPEPGDEYVDLGLSSGTLWATHNLGATSPEEYGDYFAWGETEPKDNYIWDNYQWVEIVENHILYFTKYNTEDNIGIVDGKTELDPEDDAAYVNWGPEWRMPSREQIDELQENCTWAWTKMNGVNGQLITGPNGNTIFLPAAGESLVYNQETNGYYWSRSIFFVPPYYYYPQNGTNLQFASDFMETNCSSRCIGASVRAVRI